MKAKDFLRQIKKLDKLIENKLVEIQQWKDIATNSTTNMSGEGGSSTPNPHKTADAICKYMDLEIEMQKDVDALIKAKKEIIEVIEQLNATHYDVLHKIYVQNFTLQDVASLYQRDYGWATTVQGRALKNVQRILDKREETNK